MTSRDEFFSALTEYLALREENPDRADFNNWALRNRPNMLFSIPVSIRDDEDGNFIVKAGALFPETELSHELRPELKKSFEKYGPKLDRVINDLLAEALLSYGERKGKEVKND